MTRRRVGLIAVVLGVVLLDPLGAQAPSTIAVTETERLTAETLRLRAALLDAQRRELEQATRVWQLEAEAFLTRVRAAHQVPADWVWDWATMAFEPPPPAQRKDEP